MFRHSAHLLIAELIAVILGLAGLLLVTTVVAAPSQSGVPTGGPSYVPAALAVFGGPVAATTTPISIDRAASAAQSYVASLGDPNLRVSRVVEFAANDYVQVVERDSGVGAFELIVDKYTGTVYPEVGPSLAWNTKYGLVGGMMGRNPSVSVSATMPITSAQAIQITRQYLKNQGLSLTVGTPSRFYGYYTVTTLRGSEIDGLVSVNGNTGEVWYHAWHGPFVRQVTITR